jgi:hypothetical protein
VIALAFALLAQPIPTPGPIVSDAAACTQYRQIAHAIMQEVPQRIDAVSQLDGVMVVCGLRTVAYNKSFSILRTDLVSGWQEVTQRRWNTIVCENESSGPLARRGWRFVQYLSFRSGECITMDAHC